MGTMIIHGWSSVEFVVFLCVCIYDWIVTFGHDCSAGTSAKLQHLYFG